MNHMSFLAYGKPQSSFHGGMGMQTGQFLQDNGNFGFIRMADGKDMFVMPAACEAFGNQFPPKGMQVCFEVVVDAKTGRPRGENVRPAGSNLGAAVQPGYSGGYDDGFAAGVAAAARSTPSVAPPQRPLSFPHGGLAVSGGRAQRGAPSMPSGRPTASGFMAEPFAGQTSSGMFVQNNGKFGFIRRPDGTDMFALPGACEAFDMQLPEIGTQVMFEVIVDAKTGRPRAENVRPAEIDEAQASWPSVPAQAMQQDAAVFGDDNFKMGTFVQDNGRFGFIRMADGKDMFVMPAACQAFGGAFPPQGMEVLFQVVLDAKTGRPRAEEVQPAQPAQPAFGQVDAAQPEASSLADTSGRATGTVKSIHSNGKFGFVGMADNSEDMFIMPAACTAFGNQIPAIGTPISFGVVVDAKTGKVRAEDVESLDVGAAAGSMHDHGGHTAHLGVPTGMASRHRSRSPRRIWAKNEFGTSHY